MVRSRPAAPQRPGVLVLAFGGPRGPDELVPFLTNLFDDVLPGPAWLKRIAAPRVAAARAKKVGPNYAQIGWSPVIATTNAQADALRQRLGEVPVATGMLFTAPTVADGLADLRRQGADGVVAIALFPQYSLSTTAAAFARAHAVAGDLPVHYVPAFHDAPGYVRALARTVRDAAAGLGGEGPIHLLFSPHGLPMSFVNRGDPYPEHVRETVRRTVAELGWTDPVALGWQSRVGPTRWLAPSTPEVVDAIARRGGKRLLVVPVSFVGEHIETLHELDIELAAHAKAAGIDHFGRAAAVGTDPDFVGALESVVRHGLSRFGSRACVRCLLPDAGYDGHARCPTCRFEKPAFVP